MMDITLVAVNSKYIHSNPAVRSIKYYLEARGFSADIKEFTGKEEIHRAAAKILQSDSEIIGFSCYIWNIEYILKLAQTVKKSDPERKIVFGGPEAYCNAENLLNKNPFIDAVIVGEGEKAIADMIKSGIGGKIIYGEQTDLSEIGFVYSEEDLKDKNRIFYYESSRGCPFNCAYCLSCIDKGVRYKPVEQVESELKRFTDAGIKLVKFVDRTFNSDMARAKKILEIIKNLGGETEFHIEVNPDSIDDEFIYLMSLIGKGKIRVEAGLQSINPNTLKAVHRPCNLERVKRNMRAVKIAGVTVHLDLIAGLPFEDLGSFKESFNFAFNLQPDELQLGFLKVLPGTLLQEKQDEYGIVADEFVPYEIIKNNWLSAEDIISLKNIEAVLDIYHNSGILKFSKKPLLEKFETPFEMYQSLADFMIEKGWIDFPRHKSDYLEFLFEFTKGFNLAEEITKDYFICCRKKPSWLEDEAELEKARINEVLTAGKFVNMPEFEKVKVAQRHKFAKFYKYNDKVFMVSYPDMHVQDITEIY